MCGPDPARHVEALRKAARAGYTHICVHQVGPEQEAFMDFYATEVLPRLTGRHRPARRAAAASGRPPRRKRA